MSNLTRNSGLPQLRCRVTPLGLRYDVNVLGKWVETNHSFVSWTVGYHQQLHGGHDVAKH